MVGDRLADLNLTRASGLDARSLHEARVDLLQIPAFESRSQCDAWLDELGGEIRMMFALHL